ncbi:MAG: transcription termination/antitermination protein NusA [Bacteroidales bacterium]|nr:transcription termination/antitermination protein NusA [Bacteroidales bacterium]
MNLTDTFAEFKELKNIDRVTLTRILQDVFKNAISKQYGSDENFDVIVNTHNGDLEIWHNREVVSDEDFEDPTFQIKLSDALKIDEDYEIGESVSENIDIAEFDRRVILALRQNLITKLGQIEKDGFYQKYTQKVGQIIHGEVYQIWKKEILVLDEDENELLLPKSQMIPSDRFRKGDNIRAIVLKVEIKNNNPVVILSRTSTKFLQRLFEMEVPEIEDGLITIVDIVRIPGERAKVAVESYDDRIDAVGACIGMKGARIHGIVRELRNENIDVINFTSNVALFIQRALSPAKIETIKLFEEEKRAEVYLQSEEVSKAIGKKGFNIKLAMDLTGHQIDVFRVLDEDETDDIDIDQFSEELEDWVIDEFKKVGLDTARSILDLDIEELLRRTDLEEETILDAIEIIRDEFEQ